MIDNDINYDNDNDLDQLFQMRIQRGAEPDEENDLFIFGDYNTIQDEVVITWGRDAQARTECISKDATLRHVVNAVLPLALQPNFRFIEAEWFGWGDKQAAPQFILNDAASILNFRFTDLHCEDLAASFTAIADAAHN